MHMNRFIWVFLVCSLFQIGAIGQNPIIDFTTQPSVRWKFKINQPILSSPVVNENRVYFGDPPYEHLLLTLIRLQNIDQAAIAKSVAVPSDIPAAIHQAKLSALEAMLNEKRNLQ